MKRFGLLIAILLFLTLPTGAEAAQIGIATTKNLFDVQVLPGDTYSGDITVFNTTKDTPIPVHVQLSLWDLNNQDDVEFVQATPELNAVSWFKLSRITSNGTGDAIDATDFILNPGKSQSVHFTITPPGDTPPGTYLVMMRFQTVLPPQDFQNSGPRFIPELGVPFFVKIPVLSLNDQATQYGASVVSFGPTDKPLSLAQRIIPAAHASVFDHVIQTFQAKIQDTGIFAYKASGSIVLRNVFGQTVETINIPNRYLIPNHARTLSVESGHVPGFWQNLISVGPYTATLVLDVPNVDQPVVEEYTFWAFPWQELGIVGFGLLVLLLLRRRLWLAGHALLGRGERG